MYNVLREEKAMAIIFADILKLLADNGWTQYRLLKEKQFGTATIQRLRFHQPVNTDTIDKLCELCNCQPGDLMRYEPGKKGE